MQFNAKKPNIITGFEVLIRWNSKILGEVPSCLFVPIAEKIGLISQIGEWVIQESFNQYMQWRNKGLVDNITMAINLSAHQLYNDNLLKVLDIMQKETDIPSHLIELELTETALITDPVYVIDILKKLNDLGFRTVIDDFGSGNTSLSYLTLFPISVLKIDKSFLDNMINRVDTAIIIIESIINLAHKINLEVVVEGIETEKQLTYLQNINCDFVQGFYLCKPLDLEKTTLFLKNYKQSNSSS